MWVDGIFTDDPLLAQKVLKMHLQKPADSEREIKK
jgi:hypothetical protein